MSKIENIEESFQKTAIWAQNKGFEIVFEHNGRNNISFDDMIITINASEGPETRLFSLLHECGHVLVCQDFQRYKEAFPGVWAGTIDKRRSRSKHYRVSLVEEEMLAWRRGGKLAKRLLFKMGGYYCRKGSWVKKKKKFLMKKHLTYIRSGIW